MRDSEYSKLLTFKHQQGFLVPENNEARSLVDSLHHNEIVHFKEIKERNISFHRGYFKLIAYIWDWCTPKFKQQVPKKHFYNWLKVLLGEYSVVFEFKDGKTLMEYKSISFGRMSQKSFENYVRQQLPMIYEEVIHRMYDIDKASMIIENIEEEFKELLSRL